MGIFNLYFNVGGHHLVMIDLVPYVLLLVDRIIFCWGSGRGLVLTIEKFEKIDRFAICLPVCLCRAWEWPVNR